MRCPSKSRSGSAEARLRLGTRTRRSVFPSVIPSGPSRCSQAVFDVPSSPSMLSWFRLEGRRASLARSVRSSRSTRLDRSSRLSRLTDPPSLSDVELRIGFLAPTNHTSNPTLASMDFESLYEDLVRRSSEPSLRAVAPYEGIGTVLSGDAGSDLEDDGLSDSSDTGDEFEASHSALPSPAFVPVATTSTPSTTASGTTLSVPQLALPSAKEKKNGKGGYFDTPSSSSPASTPSGARTPKTPKASKSKISSKGDWSYSHSKDILGIVMIEIKVTPGRCHGSVAVSFTRLLTRLLLPRLPRAPMTCRDSRTCSRPASIWIPSLSPRSERRFSGRG